MPFDLSFLLLVLAFVLAIFLWKRKKFGQDIPGPKGWPIVGNALQLDPEHPHLTFEKWAKEFGPIYKINIYGQGMVIVSEEEFIYDVLVRKSQDFAGRPASIPSSYLHIYRGMTFAYFSESFQKKKKFTVHTLKMYGDTSIDAKQGLKHLEEVTIDIISDLVQIWKSKAKNCFNPRADIHMTILNIMYCIIFGSKLKPTSPVMDALIKNVDLIVDILDPATPHYIELFPWLRFLGHPLYKKMDKFQHFMDTTINQLIIDNKESLDPDNMRGLMDNLEVHLMKYENQPDKQKVERIDFHWIVTELFAAGSTTTSSNLLSLIGHLTINQALQNRLRSHIKDSIGDRQVVLEDRPKLPLIEAALFEVLRLMATFSNGIPHQTIKDTSIGDFAIPKGTVVVSNIWGLHHDETFWDKPWDFNPDRFLDENGELLLADHPNRKRLLPFGAGKRVCGGETFARRRIFLILTTLIQQFQFLPAEVPPNCDPHCQTPGIVEYLPPYQIKVKPLY